MERLTTRIYVDKQFDGYCFDGINTVKDYQEAYESGYLTIVLSRAEEKLGQLEDFMEEIGFNSISELKETLTTSVVWEENQKLKDMWNKLREYVTAEFEKDNENGYVDFACVEEDILDKMQKLEKENK